jgi:hypothetical protein
LEAPLHPLLGDAGAQVLFIVLLVTGSTTSKKHRDMGVNKKDSSTTDTSYVIDGVDVKSIGGWSGITNL